ncbi:MULTISPECIES: sulfite exporter TauE/SafE family protein [Nocardia]|uniref:sulfite exporter TauE/SafE family protein n=1 Tax=Nocardia TaxID=1817 RepID=UPI000685490A|nr:MULTISPECIES: sulfite exporter TauE/SafE family protein [Nocardia]
MDSGALVAASFVAGLGVAVVTAPVGVSGAVFLLPVQISVLGVPSPAVTPTNLLFNVVSIPGALARYRRRAPLTSPLTRLLLAGTLPGVIVGAVVRVFALPEAATFKLIAAALLGPLGIWLCLRTAARARGDRPRPSRRFVTATALVVGVVGGIYGIGGGSLLSPILVGRGIPMGEVAPAALTSTLLTSVAGAATYAVLGVTTGGADIAPDWIIGISCGAGGLVGGYLGAHLQPRLPERALRYALGATAVTTAALYTLQAL